MVPSDMWCAHQYYDEGTGTFLCCNEYNLRDLFKKGIAPSICPYQCFEDANVVCSNLIQFSLFEEYTTTVLDGKKVAEKVLEGIKGEIEDKNLHPKLAVIIVGNDPASKVYVRNKNQDCEKCNIDCTTIELPESVTTDYLIEKLEALNEDPFIHGIIVQMPLPKHIDSQKVIQHIHPMKDVDCFHPENVGLMVSGFPRYLPCTPAGIMELLKFYNIDVEGKKCVVLGRSNIVGKPMSTLLLQANGTVTTCHSKTEDLEFITREADILVSAIGGIPKYIKSDMIKAGAVVIDVAMNRDIDNKLCGDVDYDNVFDTCSYITPVPGGVGPMTRAMLMKNVMTAYKLLSNII